MYDALHTHLMEAARTADPKTVSRFFKTAPGTYGAHDRFLGLPIPFLRKAIKAFDGMTSHDVARLLESPYNEVRLCALLGLVEMYKRGDEAEKQALHAFYKDHMGRVNNWNLVDGSAPMLMGDPLLKGGEELLVAYAKDQDLWVRRIGVVATWRFIQMERFDMTQRLCEMLLGDGEDLMHKACGWMLREMGKKDEATLIAFLDRFTPRMPRTMLRYALERLEPSVRAKYMRMPTL